MVAEVERGARDHALAQSVDGRVGDLGEQLMEVVEEGARLRGETGERRVHAHRRQWHRALLGHRARDLVHVVVVPPVGREAHGEGCDRATGAPGLVKVRREFRRRALCTEAIRAPDLDGVGRGQVREVDGLLVDPVAIGLLARKAVANLVVPDDAPPRGVNLEHLPGAETARAQDVLGFDVDGPHLGGKDQAIVARHVVARRAQAVAVERGAQHPTVREDNRRGPVPGLHEHGLVAVVGAALLAERRVPVPGLRHHERDRAVERATVHDEELEHVVQDRGVRALAVDDRHHALEVGPQHGRVEPGLARADPAHVAAQGVDLAVVDEIAVGVGALPGGRGVGRVARVHEGERRLHRGIVEVQVEAAHLGGHEHALVHDGPAGHAADVEDLAGERGLGVGRALDRAPGHVETALEVLTAGHVVRAAQERLADRGHAGPSGGAQVMRVHRDLAPEHERKAALRAAALEDLARGTHAGGVVMGQEEHGHAVVALVGKDLALLLRLLAEEAVRHLEEHARAVAGVALEALAAAVLQVHEHRERVVERLVAAPSVQVRDRPDAAGVVFVALPIETALHGTPLVRLQGAVYGASRAGEKSETNSLRARHARVSRPPSARRAPETVAKRTARPAAGGKGRREFLARPRGQPV